MLHTFSHDLSVNSLNSITEIIKKITLTEAQLLQVCRTLLKIVISFVNVTDESLFIVSLSFIVKITHTCLTASFGV